MSHGCLFCSFAIQEKEVTKATVCSDVNNGQNNYVTTFFALISYNKVVVLTGYIYLLNSSPRDELGEGACDGGRCSHGETMSSSGARRYPWQL